MPVNNRSFWKKKLSSNVTRDRRVTAELRRSAWKVVRIWEHELRLRPTRAVNRIKRALIM